MTDFTAKDSAIGLDIGLGTAAPQPINLVDGLAYYKNTMGIAVPVLYHLTMSVKSDTIGKGGGLVHGDGGISCTGHGSDLSGMSGTCQANFPPGTNVNLYQTPDSDSTWATWLVPGCSTAQNCAVSMNGTQNITVIFPYSFMAKVNSNGYGCDSLTQAYGNAGTVDTIYSRAVTFTEDFTLGGDKAIMLLGGLDAWYLPQDAWTTLQGKLTIQGGSMTVERLVIK